MKKTNLWSATLALGLLLGSGGVLPMLHAQSPQPQAGQQSDEKKTETFTGQVVKARNGQYALLMDEQTGKGFYLDDQEKAKEYEGKNVKVTGVLEAAKNLIHISDIQPA